jgi:Flp pilus assembly protein TadG
MHCEMASKARIPARLRRMLCEPSGSAAVLFAVLVPVLVGLAAVMTDTLNAHRIRTKLQTAVDAAALATAGEMRLWSAGAVALVESGRATTKAQLAGLGVAADIEQAAAITVELDQAKSSVRISASAALPNLSSRLLGAKPTQVAASASAVLRGSQKICLVGLEPQTSSSLFIQNNAKVQAPDCSTFSNSVMGGAGLKVDGLLESARICTAGGYTGGSGNYVPKLPITCPRLKDPLAGRAKLPSSPCALNAPATVITGVTQLSPGTHCGGISIKNKAVVTLVPGTHVISNGSLLVEAGGTLKGDYVTLYFTGLRSTPSPMTFEPNSTVSLSASKSGPAAGMLIFQEPGLPYYSTYSIKSTGASRLLGTIYLPQGTLEVDVSGKISESAAFTVVVASQIRVKGGANLVLNANYGATDVPVPDGVGPVGGSTALTD